LGAYPELLAVGIERFDADFGVSRNSAVNVRYAQAAFEVGRHFAFTLGDLRIDEDGEAVILLIVVIIADDDDTVEPVDLDGRQRYADFVLAAGVPVQGGGFHIGYDLFDFGSDDADPL